MMHLILPALLLFHPGHVETQAPEWNCDEPMAQQEMNYCAAQEYREADAALNAQWEKTSSEMKRRDEAWGDMVDTGDDRPGYFATLLEAQRAWIAFRDAHCRSEAYAFRGGSMEPLIDATCKTALTEARTAELRELIETL